MSNSPDPILDHLKKRLSKGRVAFHALGKEKTSNGTDDQRIIRGIVAGYIRASKIWIKGLLSLALLGIAIDRNEGYQLTVILVLLAIVFEASYGQASLNMAKMIWAYLGRCDVADPKELEILIRNYDQYYIVNTIVSVCTLLMRLAAFVFFIINGPFWDGFLLFVSGLAVTETVPQQVQWNRIIRFRKAIKEDTFALAQEYDSYWKYNELRNPLQITYGTIITFFYMVFLYIQKIVFPKNLFFIIYFSVLLTGCLLHILYSRKSRVHISKRAILRKPLSPRLSRILSLHLLHSFVFDVLFNFLSVGAILYGLHKMSLFLMIIVMAPTVWINRYILCNGTIKLFKRILDSNFNIVILRRFSSEFAGRVRTMVYPAFGAYGQLFSLQDATLDKAKGGPNPDSEDILGEFHEFAVTSDEEWKLHVSRYLSITDLCILDWPDIPTSNMERELVEAFKKLPSERIVFIFNEKTFVDIMVWFLGNDVTTKGTHYIIANENFSFTALIPIAYKIMKGLKVKQNQMTWMC